MFVLNDPRDWALDVQIMTDLLLSHQGYLGTYSPRNGDPALPNCGWQEDGQPFLFFSNADLFWSANYPLPRLGQGAFQASLAGLWRRITGGHELRRTCIGKPYGETYRFAERVLTGHRHEVLRRIAERKAGAGAAGQQEQHAPGATSPLRTVYMVGDNPESDIAGANSHRSEHGTEWVSVLVRTGVWSETLGKGREQLKGEFRPRAIARDVAKALEWVLQRERSRTKGPVGVEDVEELAR
jgi:HAD superfamily hydrolase (TIGR01456 family)